MVTILHVRNMINGFLPFMISSNDSEQPSAFLAIRTQRELILQIWNAEWVLSTFLSRHWYKARKGKGGKKKKRAWLEFKSIRWLYRGHCYRLLTNEMSITAPTFSFTQLEKELDHEKPQKSWKQFMCTAQVHGKFIKYLVTWMCPVLSRKELIFKAMHYGDHNYAYRFYMLVTALKQTLGWIHWMH